MSWGTELWDGYDPVCKYIESGLGFLDGTVAAFIKERGSIECEYAKKLRSLVDKYTPKGMSLTQTTEKYNNSTKKKGGTLKRAKNKDVDHPDVCGPASMGLIKPTKDDEYGHMNAYKSVSHLDPC